MDHHAPRNPRFIAPDRTGDFNADRSAFLFSVSQNWRRAPRQGKMAVVGLG